jgi:hypothetical protein
MNEAPPRSRLLRIILGAAGSIGVAVLGAGPAAAHGGTSDTGPANYRSEITDPGAPGLSWRVLGGDNLVELTNTTDSEVVVLGYQGEPYLRFTPGVGVQRNANSPATYLNEDRFGDTEIPPTASAAAEPDWVAVSTTDTYAWRDHRAHWMSRAQPPQVAADPARGHLISSYSILLLLDGMERVTARGELRWLPDRAWWPPIVFLGVTFTAIVGVVAIRSRPTDERWVALARTTLAIVSVVVVANLIRTIDDLATHPTASERAVIVITGAVSLAAIVALCVGAWRGQPRAFATLVAAALLLMLLYGGEASGDLTAPQLTTSMPDWIRRWTVAASYTVIAPAALAAAVAGRWYARTRPPAAEHERPPVTVGTP